MVLGAQCTLGKIPRFSTSLDSHEDDSCHRFSMSKANILKWNIKYLFIYFIMKHVALSRYIMSRGKLYILVAYTYKSKNINQSNILINR